MPVTGPTTVSTPNGGSLTIDTDGSYTYAPATGFVGTETVVYDIEDESGATDAATIYLSVFDGPPIVEDDVNLTPVNTPVDGNVLTNDRDDIPGQPVTIADGSGVPLTAPVTLTTTAGGQLVIEPDGSYTYTPPEDFVGEDTITLEVCDAVGNCVESVLVLDVVDSTSDADNAPPVALDDHFETHSDPLEPGTLSSSLFGNDGDPDGQAFVVSEAGGVPAGTPFTTAAGGVVTVLPDGTFDYTPAPGFMGEDSFDYSIVDTSGVADDATVTISVAPVGNPAVNTAPDANDDAAITQKNTPQIGNALINDVDANPTDALLVTAIDGNPVSLGSPTEVSLPSGSVVVINSDGSYSYTPADDFVGTESLPYTISDDNGGVDTATLYLSVFDTPPELEDDINNTSVDLPVSGNVLTNDNGGDPQDEVQVGDGSGNALTEPTVLTTDQGGTLLIGADGEYTYTPPQGFVGEDSIELEVCDEAGNCGTQTLVVQVGDTAQNPNNTQPIAENDNFSTFSDPTNPETLTSSVLGNDGDPDADPIEVVSANGLPAGIPFTTANGGSVTVNADGTFEYTPAPGFMGTDSFSYVVVDTSGATDDAQVTIEVQPDSTPGSAPGSNDALDANDDAAITPLNESTSGNLLSNDVDPNGDALQIVAVDGNAVTGPTTLATPNGGTLVVSPDGTYDYTPPEGFVGTESLVYEVSDGAGGADEATLLLSVFDSPPEIEDDVNTTSSNMPVAGNVLTNDNGGNPLDEVHVGDGAGNPISDPVTLTTDAGGTIVLQPNGDYVYTPPQDFSGGDSVTIEICDAGGNCFDSTLSIEVIETLLDPTNTGPIALDDNFETFSLSLIHI